MPLRVADPVIRYLRTQIKVNATIKIACLAIYLAAINSLVLTQSLGDFPAVSVPTTASKLARENIQMQTILICAMA